MNRAAAILISVVLTLVAATCCVAQTATGCEGCMLDTVTSLPNNSATHFFGDHDPRPDDDFYPLYLRTDGSQLQVTSLEYLSVAATVNFSSPTAPAFIYDRAVWALENGGVTRKTWSGEVTLRESGPFPCNPAIAIPLPPTDAVAFVCDGDSATVRVWSIDPFDPRSLWVAAAGSAVFELHAVGGVIIATTVSGASSFNSTTGLPAWNVPGALRVSVCGACGENVTVLLTAGPSGTNVTAVQSATGEAAWNTPIAAVPVAANRTAVALTSVAFDSIGTLVALVTAASVVSVSRVSASGEVLWTSTAVLPSGSQNGTLLAVGATMQGFQDVPTGPMSFVCTSTFCTGFTIADGAAARWTYRPTAPSLIESVSLRGPTHSPYVLQSILIVERDAEGSQPPALRQIVLRRPQLHFSYYYCESAEQPCAQCYMEQQPLYTGCEFRTSARQTLQLVECLDQGTRVKVSLYDWQGNGAVRCADLQPMAVYEFGFTCDRDFPVGNLNSSYYLASPCEPNP
eukprot:CAMPEP_0174844526 /NCGR_PEP_ID=MMETSP1114-20130205/11148_1 /TAXON_ID=312471 /ORGANISM="Neobodo designis, Strain CCAP 1951/1" /LENGTH=512 /DNA_ID=CAMNT_0016078763 /DNA_START=33 /DNA_END=1571 /DNA_ORIENTATION=+